MVRALLVLRGKTCAESRVVATASTQSKFPTQAIFMLPHAPFPARSYSRHFARRLQQLCLPLQFPTIRNNLHLNRFSPYCRPPNRKPYSSTMALNAASHNVTGDRTGPVTGPPPPVSKDSKADILDGASADATGQSAPGRDGGEKDVEKKVKTEKELEKERKKAEKDAKFKAKKAAQAAASGPGKEVTKEGKPKERKAKTEKEVLPEYEEETKPGDKKILKSLDDAFHKAYIPKVVESAWYDWWDKEGFFKPELQEDKTVKPAGKFVIPIPPPNVTGKLHCGHALATALQDLLIRWHRMKGFTTLYLPGCDHAGISTQSVVENMLWRRQKKTRYDLGRPKFLETTMAWKDEYHSSITKVLKRMGGSYDWSREAFTMDKNLSAAVTETFVRMHEEGLIYRSNRLVNWCTKLNTALSNLEVDNKELNGRTLLDVPGYERKVEFGVITHFKYPIDGTDEFIEVATTRPETMLGDTAIAVHPEDGRYKHLVGKKAKHPFVDRLLVIVADDYVDKEFGTGAVKITPAHDPNDFAIGQRHNLAFVNILNDNGTMNKNTGSFAGQKRFDARYAVTEELTKLGLFVKKEDNPMKVPLCSKSKDVIEPLMKPQWWMKMKSLAEPAIKAVKDGQIKIRPETSEKVYNHWLENINDWCLSRQLWWGHQVPAYLVKVEGEDSDQSDDDLWVSEIQSTNNKRSKGKVDISTSFVGRDASFVLTTTMPPRLLLFKSITKNPIRLPVEQRRRPIRKPRRSFRVRNFRSSETRTFWIPGLALVCGHSAPLVGLRRPSTWTRSSQPLSSKLDGIFFSSG